MSVIEHHGDETAEQALDRLADLTDGLPFHEMDSNAMLIERAIRLAKQQRGAVEALRTALEPQLPWNLREASIRAALKALDASPLRPGERA